jgi:hypothetical protein
MVVVDVDVSRNNVCRWDITGWRVLIVQEEKL